MKHLRTLIVLGLLLHVLSAWFNEGYFHPDEHFQILEFASYKLGRTPAGDLPWEFRAAMRPTLQPWLVYAFHRLGGNASMDHPFFAAFMFRLLSALLGFVVAFGLWRYGLRSLKEERSRAVLTVFTFLFYANAFLHARFSSENWGGLLFFGGLLVIVESESSASQLFRLVALPAAGALLGLSFWCRFQMGFALVGLACWLLCVRRTPVREAAGMFAGFVLACAVGVIADRLFYGEWVLTPVRYFTENIIHGRAAVWGTQAWYFYLAHAAVALIPPFSLVFLFLLFAACWKFRRHVVVWVFVAFVLGHMGVGHKEARFLFAMIYALPLLLALGTDATIGFWQSRLRRRQLRAGWYAFMGVNAVLLAVFTFIPAQESMSTYRWMLREGRAGPYVLYTFRGITPYELTGVRVHYYATSRVRLVRIDSAEDLARLVAKSPRRLHVFFEGLAVPPELRSKLLGWTPEVRSIPPWLARFNFNNWLSRVHVWNIYACTRAG